MIQTAPSHASALTSDQTQRLLLEERIRFDKETQALKQQIKDLQSGASTANTTRTARSGPDNRIKAKDSYGNTWFQVVHYCSKNGYNVSHSNEACKDRDQPGRNQWIPGATLTDHKGGSEKNKQYYQHWYYPITKRFAPSPL